MSENIKLNDNQYEFVSACEQSFLNEVTLFLDNPNFDPTFTDQQILYTAMLNRNADLFLLLINSKKFNLTLNNNELFGAALDFYKQGDSFYIQHLLNLKSIVFGFSQEDEELLEQDHKDVYKVLIKSKAEHLKDNIKLF
jgi:hypothetical protein